MENHVLSSGRKYIDMHLIGMVKQHEVLYNRQIYGSARNYFKVTHRLWYEISTQLNALFNMKCSVAEWRGRWQLLRKDYSRRTHAETPFVPRESAVYQQLDFLRPYIQRQPFRTLKKRFEAQQSAAYTVLVTTSTKPLQRPIPRPIAIYQHQCVMQPLSSIYGHDSNYVGKYCSACCQKFGIHQSHEGTAVAVDASNDNCFDKEKRKTAPSVGVSGYAN